MALLTFTLLASSPAEAARPRCGDGKVAGTEQCDGTALGGGSCSTLGYAGGTLSCSSTCTYDTSGCTAAPVCGDGVVNGYEECDGAAATACPTSCSADCACPATAAGDLEIHVIDVGQGDAILVISPDGFAMLVDAGTASGATTVQAYMATIGLTSLDYVLVSHMHADHLGGMDGILAAYPEIVASFDNGGTATSTEYADYDSAAGTRRTTVAKSDLLDLGPSMTAEVLHSAMGSSNENNNSVVIALDYGAFSYLLGGDCEQACEATLTTGRIHVYKVHHHGADNSSTATLLDAMDPWTAVISVGAGNAYGHPTTAALNRLADAQATVYRTDLDGNVPILATPSSYTVDGFPVCSTGDSRTCGTTDVGACSLGWYDCALGVWNETTCNGAVYATTEVCTNLLDDDCDGLTDSADPDCASKDVRLAQVAYDTPGTDSVEEYVDLYNFGTTAVDLSGWTLSDNAATYTLPAGTSLAASRYLTVARNAAGLYAWTGLNPDVSGMSLSLGNSGDRIVLKASDGSEIDRVAWESYEAGWTIAAKTGQSLYRSPVTTDTGTQSDWTTAASMPLGGY